MKILFSFLIALISISKLSAQQLPEIISNAFGIGEELNYKVKYGFITCGSAVLKVTDTNKKFGNKSALQLTANGRTAGSFDVFYKVRNRYDSYISQATLKPYLFTENIKENNYRRNAYVNFDREKNSVNTNKGVYDVPQNTLDIISAFYFARCIDFKDFRQGKKFDLSYYMEDKVHSMTVEYIGKEKIKTDAGTFEALKFSPSLVEGRVFKEDSKMFLWVSNDLNRIPLRVQVEILVGSIVIELTDYKGLTNQSTALLR